MQSISRVSIMDNFPTLPDGYFIPNSHKEEVFSSNRLVLKREAIQAAELCDIQTWFLLLRKFVLYRVQRRPFRILSPSVLCQTFQGLRRAFWRDRAKRRWRWLKTFLPSLTVLKLCLLLFLFLRGCGHNELYLTYQEVTEKRFITIMG